MQPPGRIIIDNLCGSVSIYPKFFALISLVLIAVAVAVELFVVTQALVAVVVIEVVIIVTVAVVWVEAVALGCKYFLLVSSTSFTANPVSFNFTHQTVPKILLFHTLDNLHTEGVFWFSSFSPLKFLENFNFIPLGIVVIVVTVLVLI